MDIITSYSAFDIINLSNKNKGQLITLPTKELVYNQYYSGGNYTRYSLNCRLDDILAIGGCVIAGGFFTSKPEWDQDIDIFIYDNHEEVLNKIMTNLETLSYIQKNRGPHLIEYVTKNIVIQIILTKYTSIANILYDFDLGPSQVAFDGEQFYFTTMSKLAFDTGFMIIDHNHTQSNAPYRVTKYNLEKRFKPIFPFLNTDYKDENYYTKLGFCFPNSCLYITIDEEEGRFSSGYDAKKSDDPMIDLIKYYLGIKNSFKVSYSENIGKQFLSLNKEKLAALVLEANILPTQEVIDTLINADASKFETCWRVPLPIKEIDPEQWYEKYFRPIYHSSKAGPLIPLLVKQVHEFLYSLLPEEIVNLIFEMVDEDHLCLRSLGTFLAQND